MTRPLDIVILGGGTAGWMAAAAFASVLPPSRCRIRVVESEEIGAVGVGEATLPQVKSFHDVIGVSEAAMMQATQATFKLGIRFVDWGYIGSSYIHPFGTFGPPVGGLSFHHRWLRALQSGRDNDIQDFSFAAVAAAHNRFDFPASNKSAVDSTYAYAYHFDASLYAAFLRHFSEARGVTRTEGVVVDVHLDSATGNINSLQLQSGELVPGDFFLDCSGFRSLLLGKALEVGWEDWSRWLPCDRAFAVPSATADELTPYTRSVAMEGGWRWRIPLQQRTGNGYVFSSQFIDEAHAAESLLDSLDAPSLGEPRLLKFQSGRRLKSWQKNCVALGLASGFLEPLESTSIYLIQIAIMHLVSLLPNGPSAPVLAGEFNRKMDIEYERIRDFLILHYHLNTREDSEIWRYCRHMEVPSSLTEKMNLFGHSGVVPSYRDGLFTPPSWLSVYLGQGLTPTHYHPLANRVPIDQLVTELEALKVEIERRVHELPRHENFLANYAPSADHSKHQAEGN